MDTATAAAVKDHHSQPPDDVQGSVQDQDQPEIVSAQHAAANRVGNASSS